MNPSRFRVAAIWGAEQLKTGAGVDVAAVMLAVCYATYGGVASHAPTASSRAANNGLSAGPPA